MSDRNWEKGPRIHLRPGLRRLGSVYEGPATYQDWEYKEASDRLIAERAKNAKPKDAA